LQILILILAILVALLLIYFANKQRHHYQKVNKQHEQYNAELEHSLAFKNRLMSIVAHDIRNPIASLRGLIKVFNDGLVDEKDLGEMMHGLESMVVNVDLLLENLLTWVRSESEDLEAYMEDVELEDLLKNAVLEASPQLQTKGVTIDIKDPSKIPVLHTDFNFVSFILRNILSNAIKYSYEKGSISIICTQNEEQLCIEVQDYGKGMSRETLDQLRTNSVSQSRKGTDNEKGTALGLSLSYYFLNRLNGAMEIESELGQGTKVQIFLPLAAT
jgi:two-component system sensor histidine kinase/response regulator